MIEYVNEMKELGTEDEPLLAEAIAVITGTVAKNRISKENAIQLQEVRGIKESSFHNQMYIEKKLPTGFRF